MLMVVLRSVLTSLASFFLILVLNAPGLNSYDGGGDGVDDGDGVGVDVEKWQASSSPLLEMSQVF